jgi:hypothetical protein
MSGITESTTANTKIVIGNLMRLQEEVQALITGGSTIVTINQAKAAQWLIVFV